MNLRCVLHVVSVLMLVVAAAMATAALACARPTATKDIADCAEELMS